MSDAHVLVLLQTLCKPSSRVEFFRGKGSARGEGTEAAATGAALAPAVLKAFAQRVANAGAGGFLGVGSHHASSPGVSRLNAREQVARLRCLTSALELLGRGRANDKNSATYGVLGGDRGRGVDKQLQTQQLAAQIRGSVLETVIGLVTSGVQRRATV